MDNRLHRCPDCKNQFVQPFVCTTCGAQKLYDETVRSQAVTIENLQARLTEAIEVISWKSLYNKAEMGWYANWLIATIERREPDEWEIRGKQWYDLVTLKSRADSANGEQT